MEADEDEGTDGYVATPGGRVWYLDTTDMVASQLCGEGCVASDPNFMRGAAGPVASAYSYKGLRARDAR